MDYLYIHLSPTGYCYSFIPCGCNDSGDNLRAEIPHDPPLPFLLLTPEQFSGGRLDNRNQSIVYHQDICTILGLFRRGRWRDPAVVAQFIRRPFLFPGNTQVV